MPHSVSHCSGYYSFIEDDPDFQRDVVAFLRNGHMTNSEQAGHELVELSTFSDAAQPGIKALKDRAKSWDRASQRADSTTSEEFRENMSTTTTSSTTTATTRLRGVPSRAIQVIKEESVQGSPIRISSESWSLHNEGEEDDDDEDDDDDDDDNESDTTTETDSQTAGSPNPRNYPPNSNKNRQDSPPYQAQGRYSPASSNKFQVHNWQLCLYVFGGQEASTPGMYRSPMTVWQLYV